jgi:predicted RNA-binding Zn-ribbon protein involved in translation (DUF1610 family)
MTTAKLTWFRLSSYREFPAMADSIVSCTSCGKKYRIRDGSQPGSFACTDCGAQVSYGAVAQARPAQARPAKGPARPAAGGKRRQVARSRPASHQRGRRVQREGGPPPKSNAPLYIGLSVLGVVVVAVIAIVAMSSDDPKPVGPGPDVADNSRDPDNIDPDTYKPSKRPDILNPDLQNEEPDPEPDVKPVDTKEPDRIKKTDRSVKEKDLPTSFYELDAMQLRQKRYKDLKEQLKHFDDTPEDLRREIDKLCATIVDFHSGSDGPDAQARLAEIGRPAIPMILAAYGKAGDLNSREGKTNACVVDDTLRDMLGDPAKITPIKPMNMPTKDMVLKNAARWCVWWYTKGHKLEKLKPDPEEEEEEEE